MHTVTCGTIEIDGTAFDKEVDYSFFSGGLCIEAVRAIKIITARADDVWYDRQGKAHRGRHVELLDVTGFVDIDAIAEEVADHIGVVERLAA